MASRVIFKSVGVDMQNFVSEMTYMKSIVSVSFTVKRKNYGAKIYIIANNKQTNKNIIMMMTKVRSVQDISSLQKLVCGLKHMLIDHYNNSDQQ